MSWMPDPEPQCRRCAFLINPEIDCLDPFENSEWVEVKSEQTRAPSPNDREAYKRFLKGKQRAV